MNNIGLGLQQTQKLLISPQLQHAIKLLQLSSIELAETIETELAENPFLEETLDGEEEKKEIETDEENSYDEHKYLEMDIGKREITLDNQNEETFFADSSDLGYVKKSSSKSDENSKQQFLENAFSVETTLYDHLLSQLRLIDISDFDFHIGEIIISSINENGYFTTPLDEVAESVTSTSDTVLKVLKIIQAMDPPGISGRNLSETLLIQMEQLDTKNPIAEKILKDHFSLLKKREYKKLANKMHVSLFIVKQAIDFISQLEPIPARQFDTYQIKYIIPDVVVEKIAEGFVIMINDHNLPTVKFNHHYKQSLQNIKLQDEAKTFFDSKVADAKLLLFSLEKRKITIKKVVEQLVEHQKDFFLKGPQYLEPLILKDIANKIDMHESTVSRVTANKYIETPWGIFPFKYFFSIGIRKNDGQIKSSRSIKEIIKEIIENENGNEALSDNKIVQILSNRGIEIARRTVAKYRKSLKISSSFQRNER